MATPWIKLSIDPDEDPKVQRIADLTGKHPEKVFCAVVRWFRWVDRHLEAGTTISRRAFRQRTRWKDDSLADAMLTPEVDWLEVAGENLRPTRPLTHFGTSEKARAQTAKRAERYRKRDDPSRSRHGVGAPDQTRPDEREMKNQTTDGDVRGESGLGGWPEWNSAAVREIESGHLEGVLRAIGLRSPMLEQTAELPRLTVAEIVDTANAVGADPGIRKPSVRAAIVADRLFRSRRLERPKEHRGGKATKVGGHVSPAVLEAASGLARVVQARGYKA